MIRLLVIVILLSAAVPVAAQLRLLQRDSLDWPTPHHAVVVNAGGVAVDYTGIAYLRRVADHHAVGGFARFVYRPVGAYLPRGVGAGLLYRFYPGGQALWRFHYSAQAEYLEAWLTGDRATATGGLGIGLTLGWQWFPIEDFGVGFSIGQQYVAPLKSITNDALAQLFGFRPLLSFDLGYAWGGGPEQD